MKSSIINARGAETAPAGMIELFLRLFFPFFPRISTRRDAELIFEAESRSATAIKHDLC